MAGSGHGLRILRACVFRWSTDQVDPADRFDHWREVRAKGLFGVTAELEPERREHFRGEFALQPIGKAGLIEIRASPYRVERTAADITNAPSDSLCIYQQLSQGGWFDTLGDGLHGSARHFRNQLFGPEVPNRPDRHGRLSPAHPENPACRNSVVEKRRARSRRQTIR